jgi:hypothetical protein
MSAFIAGLVATVILVAATVFLLDNTQISEIQAYATKATHVM